MNSLIDFFFLISTGFFLASLFIIIILPALSKYEVIEVVKQLMVKK